MHEWWVILLRYSLPQRVMTVSSHDLRHQAMSADRALVGCYANLMVILGKRSLQTQLLQQ